MAKRRKKKIIGCDEPKPTKSTSYLRKGAKKISLSERRFADLLYKKVTFAEAARIAFKWKCEPGSKEYDAAKYLAYCKRVRDYLKDKEEQELKQAKADFIASRSTHVSLEDMRQYCFDRLIEIREDPGKSSRERVLAIELLETLADPSKDINLIWRWIDIIWRYYNAHCPCCHSDFPLWKIKNERLEEHRKKAELPEEEGIEDEIERRLGVIYTGEKRKKPHPSQMKIVAAPERHIVGTGPARTGKSLIMAWMAVTGFLIPGAETWIIARIYENAGPEVEYLINFLRAAFHPVYKYMVDESIDKKTGEVTITSRWGSVLRVRSSKAVGSITGRELELCLVAEPAWVDGDILQEVRARMSSRLGRIVAIGTPKGYGGFLNRLINLSATDPETGRKRKRHERLMENGCPWNESMLIVRLKPEDNPGYVLSELDAARKELTDEEFASEFEGLMVSGQGHKFPCIEEEHLIQMPHNVLRESVFVLGVDQGPKNFGACLVAWDGDKFHVTFEFLDNKTTTIKSNMMKLNDQIPKIIAISGGQPENWKLSIFDTDPIVTGYFEEMADERSPWKTELTYKPKNKQGFTNWREEVCMWINQLAKEGKLLFDYDNTFQLHQQLMETLIRPPNDAAEQESNLRKGWLVKDKRGDHVMDGFVMAMHCFKMGMVRAPEGMPTKMNAVEEQKAVRNFLRAQREKAELSGMGDRFTPQREDELYQQHFNKNRPRSRWLGGMPGWYTDES